MRKSVKKSFVLPSVSSKSVIRFWSISGQWGLLSNYANTPFQLDGKYWPTVEHYYQAQKTDDQLIQDAIRKCDSPIEAVQIGKWKIRAQPGWDNMRLGVMRRALRAKFAQNKKARATLLSTGKAVLYENDSIASFWSGKGENNLGKLLMELREILPRG